MRLRLCLLAAAALLGLVSDTAAHVDPGPDQTPAGASPRCQDRGPYDEGEPVCNAETDEPPVPDLEHPFRLPLMFTAWGFRTGDLNATELAGELVHAGIRTVALQIGEASADVAAVFHARGIQVVLWGVAGDQDDVVLDAFHADGYIVQVEGPGQYEAALENLRRGVGRGLPIGIATNFGGLSSELAKPLIDAGAAHTFVETYRDEQPWVTVPRMIATADAYGLPDPIPLVGLYGGHHVREYQLGSYLTNRRFAVWTAELLQPQDWNEIADWLVLSGD